MRSENKMCSISDPVDCKSPAAAVCDFKY